MGTKKGQERKTARRAYEKKSPKRTEFGEQSGYRKSVSFEKLYKAIISGTATTKDMIRWLQDLQ